ncbi:MAG: efflux RND transporter periplasmic adaptor subunit [Rhizobiales bacterium]|nr:efflux RND transporter periplasmic adaptor subunit [Hyphomicrobiales bacterium]MBI3674726.1 efflux RND transporter periplasmic adaptor subunit [Hyphomicrobiales bacterium]
MKKRLIVLAVILVAGGSAVALRPQWFDFARPYVPAQLQSWLVPAAGDNKPAGGKSGGRDQAAGPIAVTVATATAASLPVVERTYGVLQSPAVVAIGTRISSQVTVIHVRDGQDVKAGDLLVSLDDRMPRAQLAKDKATLLKDQALALSAAADMQRAKSLAEKQAGSQQAYDQALAAQKAADATVAADRATIDSDLLQIDFTRIVAPIDGRLGAVAISVGDLVTTGASANLFTITEMTPLKVSFRLPETVLAAIRSDMATGTTVAVRVLRAGTTEVRGSGNLDFIDSGIDPASGTIAMSATLPNAGLALWPGEHVDVEVDRGTLTPAAVVPTVAVQPGQNGSFVWLIKSDDTVEVRAVTVARSDAGRSAIASGLAPGDRVVVEGQLRLKPGATVKPVAAAGTAEGENLAEQSANKPVASP